LLVHNPFSQMLQFAASLTGGSFEESRMLKNVEACEWLAAAIHNLEVPNLDPSYTNIRAVSFI
jgi:exocyst complex component 1